MWTVHWDIQANEGESNRRRGKLPNAGLHDLCCPPRIVRAIKSEMMGELKNVCRILMSKLKEGDHLEDLGVDWGILLK